MTAAGWNAHATGDPSAGEANRSREGDALREALRAFILDEVLNRPDLRLSRDQDLLASGLVDSLGMVSLVDFIEERTGLDIPPEDVTLENFVSLRAIERYLDELREGT